MGYVYICVCLQYIYIHTYVYIKTIKEKEVIHLRGCEGGMGGVWGEEREGKEWRNYILIFKKLIKMLGAYLNFYLQVIR